MVWQSSMRYLIVREHVITNLMILAAKNDGATRHINVMLDGRWSLEQLYQPIMHLPTRIMLRKSVTLSIWHEGDMLLEDENLNIENYSRRHPVRASINISQ